MAYVTDIKSLGSPIATLWARVAAGFGRAWNAIVRAQEARAQQLAEDHKNGRRFYF